LKREETRGKEREERTENEEVRGLRKKNKV
jgi:hypothetical protein